MSSETMTLSNFSPPVSPRLIKDLGEGREKRLMTTEEFDLILKNEPPARLTLASNRRGSFSNNKLDEIRVSQPLPRGLKKQMSFDNFSHKLQHKAVGRPPRTSLPHIGSYTPNTSGHSTTTIVENTTGSSDHGHPDSDTETNSDTSSSGPAPNAEKKSLSSLIKKTFGKKSKKHGEKDAILSSELSVPQSPSASLFSISPQPSPVESIFDHNKSTLDSLRGQQAHRYQVNDEKDDDEEDWTDTGLPATPPPLLKISSRSYSTPTLPLLPTDKSHPSHSIASLPFQLGPVPKSDGNRKSMFTTSVSIPLPQPSESPRATKVTFKPVEEVIHYSGEDSSEEPTARSRSSSISSNESFHAVEESTLQSSSPPSQPNSQPRPAIPKYPSILKDSSRNDKERDSQIETLKLENSNLLQELEKVKRQLSLEHSARSTLLKSMENARSQFDEISAQAYRKLRQVTSENRRLHSEVKKLKEKVETLDV